MLRLPSKIFQTIMKFNKINCRNKNLLISILSLLVSFLIRFFDGNLNFQILLYAASFFIIYLELFNSIFNDFSNPERWRNLFMILILFAIWIYCDWILSKFKVFFLLLYYSISLTLILSIVNQISLLYYNFKIVSGKKVLLKIFFFSLLLITHILIFKYIFSSFTTL